MVEPGENTAPMTETQIPDGPFDLQTRETRGSVTRAPALSNQSSWENGKARGPEEESGTLGHGE